MYAIPFKEECEAKVSLSRFFILNYIFGRIYIGFFLLRPTLCGKEVTSFVICKFT